MKSKENLGNKSVKRSTYKDFDDKLKPVKSANGKAGKRISIYGSMDDEFDESELNGVLNLKDIDSDEDYDDDDYDFDVEEDENFDDDYDDEDYEEEE